MARLVSTRRKAGNTAVGLAIGLLLFFPVLWTFLTSFKTASEAIASPPSFLFFDWTLDNYRLALSDNSYVRALFNSILLAVGSTLLAVIIAVPAAWAMAFVPGRKTKDLLLWMLSTKMLPAVGVLYPITIIYQTLGLFDTRLGLMIILMIANLPIVVWMLYTYFKEIPGEILEAARMDGAPLSKEILHVLAPMAVPGIASTMLLNIILAWNEGFWTLRLVTVDAVPLSQYIVQFNTNEGLPYAKLAAASMLAVGPILILGWFAQKQLVRGLTFGAVK